jgi:FkbM family methyltransferase
VLDRALAAETHFIDAGANIGWWSLYASTRLAPGRILAVEASPRTYRQLTATRELNSDAFVTVNAALWDRPGERLWVGTPIVRRRLRHPRARVRDLDPRAEPAEGTVAVEAVMSTTIDQLVGEHWGTGQPARLVVKLDVEGAERRALAGAVRTLAGDHLLVYEDHGRDRSSAVSAHLLDRGYRVFFWGDGGALFEIRELTALARLKADRRRGYDLVACPPGSSFLAALDVEPATPGE